MIATVCPPRQELTDFALGKLPEDRSETIADHVSTCLACQDTLRACDDGADPLIASLRTPLVEEPYLQESGCREAIALVEAIGREPSINVRRDSAASSEELGNVGQYRLLAKLGQGGMGTVYKALHTRLEKVVALKLLPRERTRDSHAVARFTREMKAVGRLEHPHIVRAMDANEQDGTHYLVMEYVEGLDLSTLVSATGPLPIADACELVRQTAVGLQYAHEQGLVHRDIKPSNLMLTTIASSMALPSRVGGSMALPSRASDAVAPATSANPHGAGEPRYGESPHGSGEPCYAGSRHGSGEPCYAGSRHGSGEPCYVGLVKILDLGLALLRGDQPNHSDMTATGTAMGTADYVSPEQVTDSHAVDIRSDIYSLGCTLYKFLSGRAPFVGPEFKNDVTKMMAHVHQTPPRISELRTDLPPGLAEVVERMMAKKPADRFATPGAVAEAIAPFTAGADLGALLAAAQAEPGASAASESPAAGTDPVLSSALTGTAPEPSVAIAGQEDRSQHAAAPKRSGVSAPLAASRGWGRHRLWIALAAAAAAIPLLFGVWVIIRDKSGNEVAKIHVPDGGSVEQVDEQGRPLKPRADSPETAKSGQIEIEPGPRLPRQPGEPISLAALVGRPAALPGVRSWTCETRGHRAGILDVAHCPKGKLIASAGDDGMIRLWDREKGFVRILAGHKHLVSSLSWSPDGGYLASGCLDGTISIWNPTTGQSLRTWQAHPASGSGGFPIRCRWSPDGRSLASTTGDHTIRLWNPVSGRAQRALRTARFGQHGISWSPDGTMLVAPGESDDKKLDIWDVTTGKRVRSLEGHTAGVYHVCWSPDGKRIASASADAMVLLWDAETGQQLTAIKQPADQLAWTADSRHPVAAMLTGGVVILDPTTGQAMNKFNDMVFPISLSPDGTMLIGQATTENRGTLRVKSLTTTGQTHSFPGHTSRLDSLSVSPDGGSVAVGTRESSCRTLLWNLKTAELAGKLGSGSNPIPALAWSPDGKMLAAASVTVAQETERLRVWEPSSGRCVGEVAVAGGTMSLAWSPDGQTLASGTYHDGGIQLWALAEKRVSAILRGHTGRVCALAWSRDGRSLASASGDGTVRVWDVATAATLQTLPYLATAVAWSPDGTQVLSSNWVGRLGVRIWDAATGNEVTGLPVDAGGGISFLPDGRTLLLGRNGGGGFTYWNLSPGVAERTVSLALPGWSKSYATCLDFSPDLRTAFTMWANCIMLWDTDTGKRRATLASLAGDDWLAVSADGHYRGSPGVERELVYVVEIDAGEQLTLTPEEFATRYHWKNDPSQVRLAPEPAAKQPSAPPAAGAEKP